MKAIILIFMVLFFQTASAQNRPIPTDKLIISGLVKSEKTFSIDEIAKLPFAFLNDVNTSCSPRKAERAKSVKVVRLKNMLDSVKFSYESSRSLGQFYFLFVSSDNYKTVFSFNEIYNTETGNQLYIVTEIDGVSLKDMENRILMLSVGDIKGGSRNMKGLSRIEVRLAE
jgi:hypothetical protein